MTKRNKKSLYEKFQEQVRKCPLGFFAIGVSGLALLGMAICQTIDLAPPMSEQAKTFRIQEQYENRCNEIRQCLLYDDSKFELNTSELYESTCIVSDYESGLQRVHGLPTNKIELKYQAMRTLHNMCEVKKDYRKRLVEAMDELKELKEKGNHE